MLMNRIVTLIFFLFTNIAVAQQLTLKGSIRDADGFPIPFATIVKEGSSIGTSANKEGHFNLSLPEGRHQLSISAVGYKQKTITVKPPQHDSLIIHLDGEIYTLQEVVIGNREDPAYSIIRKAIKKRPYYLKETGPYHAHVYIKGLQRLIKAPKKFFGVDMNEIGEEIGLDSARKGIIYLSESESKITVNPPKDFKEEMISSKISGDNKAFSFNRASELQLNFYENYQHIVEGLSNRPFISPIADNALAYYRYQYLGTAEEKGKTIIKIKVIPKRKAEPLYKGNIYIIEGEWRIHSVNFLLDKESSINFVDSLNLKQLYTEVTENKWMPSNIQLDFKAGLLGFQVGGYFTAIYQNYTFIDAPDKRLFREVLSISGDVNKKDSLYWAKNRPVPLSPEEQKDYIAKDSLYRFHQSKAYLDSIDRKNNRFKPLTFLTSGYNYRNRYKKESIRFNGLLTSMLFNSVEGLAINYGINYNRQLDSGLNRYFRINGRIRYGFANKHLNGIVSTDLPVKNQTFVLSGGRDVLDLNNQGSLPTLLNSLYTLFVGENYQKLYEKTFASIAWSNTLPGNIKISLQAEWSNRHWLPNASGFTFRDRNSNKLTSNNPLQPDADVPLFTDNKSTKVRVGLSYDFSNRYAMYPTGKRYLVSKYPTFGIQYTKGIKNVLGSDVDYDLLTTSVQKNNMGLGLYGKVSFSVSAGSFFNNKQLFYPDYKHFNGNRILLVDQQLSSFLALDYYQYSTPSNFVEAHMEYNLGGMFVSKVPLLRKLKLEELIGLHYLHTSELSNYSELHVGLQWKMIRLMYAHSRSAAQPLNQTNTLRIALKLF
ncbi:carboxypeptidase-like regulatory domain-containing protein [Olivibacter sp. LS-1]|jgi:hypothetical protein|nr:carboxypeptidase-like regulatory domain-containing protein [Olivibacter sp. LS-1]